jgi:hypothetical protein
MKARTFATCVAAATVLAGVGCQSKAVDTSEFRYAIDDYYRVQPHCLWPSPAIFPSEADGKSEQGRQYNALADAGVLERRPVTKGGSSAGAGTTNQYGLTAEGQTYWTADKREPGWGNFCFARPEVTSIDSFSPPGPSVAYTVRFHYSADLPAWANNSAVKTAFPELAAEGNGVAAATLARSGTLWQVQKVTPASTAPGGE